MAKLYVLVDKKLSTGQKMSQAGHAIAEYLLRGPNQWDNDTLIILEAPKYLIMEALDHGATGFQDSYYEEPRAVAFTSTPLDISGLSLAR